MEIPENFNEILGTAIKEFNDIQDYLSENTIVVVRCKNCKYAHLTYDGSCKYCDMWMDDDDNYITVYHDKNFYCGYGEEK